MLCHGFSHVILLFCSECGIRRDLMLLYVLSRCTKRHQTEHYTDRGRWDGQIIAHRCKHQLFLPNALSP